MNRLVRTVVGVVALACWVVMFLAGSDVWHDVGRPDLWRLQGPPYSDLRVFAVAFYLLFFAIAADLAWSVAGLRRPVRAA